MAKSALGRGLGALLSGGPPPKTPPLLAPHASGSVAPDLAPGARVELVPLSRIRPCPFQPRKDFPAEALRELADSIQEQGVVQPLIVRVSGDHYELIAGERRWRAAQLAGLAEVPVLVRAADDAAVLELALIENLQRENLNPIEEAEGYQQLVQEFQLRQEDVAQKVGRSRVSVANALRLLKLHPDLQTCLRNGQLSVGHAKVILGLTVPEEQRLAMERVVRDGLNVRQTEDLVSRLLSHQGAKPTAGAASSKVPGSVDVHVAALETRLQERLGTKVRLRYRQGKGSIEIRYFNDADLERILEIVGVEAG